MHRQRAEVDALAIGADTVLIDDPVLTARGCYRYRPLPRVVFDWRMRVPADARLFSTLDRGPVIMMVATEALHRRRAHAEALAARGIEFEVMADPDLSVALARLGDRRMVSLIVEGGPRLQTAFLSAGLVDRVQWIQVPRTLGDGVEAWDRAMYGLSRPARVTSLDGDQLWEFDVYRSDRDDRARRSR